MRWICFAVVLVSSSLLPGQTEEEVRDALGDYFADDDARTKARARLKAWGSKSVPHLRAIANSSAARSLGWEIVCTLNRIESDDALQTWVDIFLGKTRIEARHGRGALVPLLEQPRVRTFLDGHKGFRKGAEELRTAKSFLDRGYYLRTVRQLGWEDAAAKVRKMTMDPHGDVRKEAAETLEALTGEKVTIAKSPLVFRGKDLIEDLFEATELLPESAPGRMESASYTRWYDGTPVLLFGSGRKFSNLDTKKPREIETDLVAHGFLSLRGADGKRSFVALVSEKPFGGPGLVIGRSKDGEELWRYKPPRIGIKAAASLFDAKGEYGVVVAPGGKTGLVALDASGEKLWQVPRWYVVYGLSTHPALPGELLVSATNSTLVRHGRDRKRVRRQDLESTKTLRFTTHGVLFPDAKGQRAAIVTGESANSEPVIGRFDTDGGLIWRVFLSDEAGGLAMAETKKHGRLFFATTKDAKLLAFDAEGKLRFEAALPNPRKEKALATYGIAAGEHAPGQWSVAVGLLSGWYLFPIRN